MARRRRPDDDPDIPKSVDAKKGIELLERQVNKAEELLANPPLASAEHTAWRNTTRDYLVRAFGSRSPNVHAVMHASSGVALRMGMSDAEIVRAGASRLENRVKMLKSCIEQLETDIELSGQGTQPDQQVRLERISSNKVFVVHGHHEGVKQALAKFLERLGLQPVILHEQASKGRTIIEKFEDYSDVSFAVVLLTADDIGKAKDSADDFALRARQNVVFELGFFIGKLGRPYVCSLYEEGVRTPSDYDGVVFIPLDKAEAWKPALFRELQAAGFDVDGRDMV